MSDDLYSVSSKISFRKARNPETAIDIVINNESQECSYRLDEERIKMLLGILQEYLQDWEDYKGFATSQWPRA